MEFEPLRVRRYGPAGPTVVVLHGGPGAPGSAAGLARSLADPFHVLEPWQRWSSDVPLTVDRHVEDVAYVVARYAPGEKPALVGESWGAMLALAFASRYPHRLSALGLIGCGTFDRRARAELQRVVAERTTPTLGAKLAGLAAATADEGQRLVQSNRLSEAIYTYCRADDEEDPIERFDPKGHVESWGDMVRLQESGVYPAQFSSIECPVLMLHGAYDPHPGEMIRDSLVAHMPHLEYQQLEQCGHRPWIEEHARSPFFAALGSWLAQHVRA